MVSCRLLGSLLGKAGPKLRRVKPRVEMTLDATNRRELLKALVQAGDGGSMPEASLAQACRRCSPVCVSVDVDVAGRGGEVMTILLR